jgi:hypothetical protein
MRSLGGVTTFLFASVTASGIRILSYLKVRDCAISLWIQLIDLFIQWGRKERFVLAASLSFGMGNLLAPGWFEHLFDGVTSTSKGLNGFLSSITIILSAPCKFCPNFFYISRLLKGHCPYSRPCCFLGRLYPLEYHPRRPRDHCQIRRGSSSTRVRANGPDQSADAVDELPFER